MSTASASTIIWLQKYLFGNSGFTQQVVKILNTNRRRYMAGGTALGVAILLIGLYKKNYIFRKKNLDLQKTEQKNTEKSVSGTNGTERKKIALNKEFFNQLRFLMKIVLPSFRSKECLLLIVHTLFLISRTFLSIYVATLDGEIVKNIVDRNGKTFLWTMIKWLGVAVPATYVNSMIKFLESKLSIAFRTRLSKYVYDMYMVNETYYRVGNLDSRISNADQCLTEDVSRFCNFLAHLHSQLSKPILDVLLMGWQLGRISGKTAQGGGWSIALITGGVMFGTAKALKLIQPNFGRLVAKQGQLEGDLRFVHSRLITNSEEIAFYRGHEIEKTVLDNSYLALARHMNYIFRSSIFYNMMEGFIMKYVWSLAGLGIIAIPAFFYEKKDISLESNKAELISTRTQDFVTSKKLLISGAEAVERIMLAFKDVTELAGYTARVYNMIEVFQDVQNGKYEKLSIKSADNKIDITKAKGIIEESPEGLIQFEDVPIVSPTGDVLVSSLSFEVKPGMNLLITGPNGCGKSSLFRMLGGLWPIFGGKLVKPVNGDMFYIPQRPYLTIGSLRDQVIYPDTVHDMKRKGLTDNDLLELFQWVSLVHILDREGGWDATNEWKDLLSGGEKQRIGMARLFYHRPRYAILDECTSAVSIDVEGQMYQHAIDTGITLLTVTHRPSLWKYHEYLLQFDGEGGWKFSKLNADARLSLKDEKTKLESQLAGVPKAHKRLRELCNLLGEESVVLKEADAQNENNN